MLTFAASLYVLDTTGSAAIFATLISVSNIPLIIFSPIGGALADRFSKKKIIILADFTSLFLIALLALLLFRGHATIFLIGMVLALITTISTCYQPVVSAAIAQINLLKHSPATSVSERKAEFLIKANASVQVVKASSRFAAPIIAGVLYPLIGIHLFVAIIGVLFMFSASINFFLKLPHVKIENSMSLIKTIATDIRNGLHYIAIKDNRFLKLALTLCVIVMFYTALLAVALPFIIRVIFALSEQHFAGAKAAAGFATILGGVLASRGKISRWVRLEYFHKWIFLLGIVSMPSGFSFLLPNFSETAVYLVFVSGFFLAIIVFAVLHVLVFATIQREVPQEMVGKITSLIIAVVIAASPIGQRVMGFLLVTVPFPVIFLTISVTTLFIAAITKRVFIKHIPAPPDS